MANIIHCISGLGTDEKIFSNLSIPGYQLRFLSWITPEKNEPIAAYAKRMTRQLAENDPVILGVSFGGIMAIEMAKHVSIDRLFLVSTVKSSQEIPNWMKWTARLHIHHFVPAQLYKRAGRIGNWRLGVTNQEERALVNAYRRSSDPVYVKWAINEILRWKNNWIPANTMHIHGDSDKIFPLKRIRNSVVLKNASHFMIYNRAKEISEYIDKAMQS
jgi:pimeloyl-ACP methyl ester carboxylesterase